MGATLPSPDLILMDLNLPGRGGIELLQALRASKTGAQVVPVIIMTSSRSPAHRKEAEQIGISEFFNKPTDLEEFLNLGALVSFAPRIRDLKQKRLYLLPGMTVGVAIHVFPPSMSLIAKRCLLTARIGVAGGLACGTIFRN